MEKQNDIYADKIEFFHDKSGLSTSKFDILTATEKNICGMVTRTLIEGSIEVYPIHDYGALEIGVINSLTIRSLMPPQIQVNSLSYERIRVRNGKLLKSSVYIKS